MLHDARTPRRTSAPVGPPATWRRDVDGRLLSDREVDSLQHRARRVFHLDVPGSGPLGRHRLTAPRAPGDPPTCSSTSPLACRRGTTRGGCSRRRALQLGPADQLCYVRRNTAPVSCAADPDRPRHHGLDDVHLRGGGGSGGGGRRRCLGGVLSGEPRPRTGPTRRSLPFAS